MIRLGSPRTTTGGSVIYGLNHMKLNFSHLKFFFMYRFREGERYQFVIPLTHLLVASCTRMYPVRRLNLQPWCVCGQRSKQLSSGPGEFFPLFKNCGKIIYITKYAILTILNALFISFKLHLQCCTTITTFHFHKFYIVPNRNNRIGESRHPC